MAAVVVAIDDTGEPVNRGPGSGPRLGRPAAGVAPIPRPRRPRPLPDERLGSRHVEPPAHLFELLDRLSTESLADLLGDIRSVDHVVEGVALALDDDEQGAFFVADVLEGAHHPFRHMDEIPRLEHNGILALGTPLDGEAAREAEKCFDGVEMGVQRRPPTW